jgi:hypothetical protein
LFSRLSFEFDVSSLGSCPAPGRSFSIQVSLTTPTCSHCASTSHCRQADRLDSREVIHLTPDYAKRQSKESHPHNSVLNSVLGVGMWGKKRTKRTPITVCHVLIIQIPEKCRGGSRLDRPAVGASCVRVHRLRRPLRRASWSVRSPSRALVVPEPSPSLSLSHL